MGEMLNSFGATTDGHTGALRKSDTAGLAAAIVLHAGLAALLVLQVQFGSDPPAPVPDSMTVSLASEVSLESTAPDPVAVARASTGPELGEAAPEESAPAEAEPTPRETAAPEPRATRAPRSQPTSRPRPTPSSSPRSQATRSPRSTPSSTPTRNPGGSRFDEEFSRGIGSSPTSPNTGTPAQRYGPSELASLESVIGRQVRIKWQGRVPQGPDAEKLVTRVTFQLRPNGSLLGEPRVLGTTGITDLNRNQVGRHQEEAVRAIKLVGRFQVPFEVPDYKNTFTIRFDR